MVAIDGQGKPKLFLNLVGGRQICQLDKKNMEAEVVEITCLDVTEFHTL